jgi:aspartyl-tRNA(Asn)/glutamyl-tRNA(Gln) amidotransferase subunit C
MRCMTGHPISVDEVRRIAHLAHLTLDDAEVEHLALDLERILDYVSQVAALELPEAPTDAPAPPGAADPGLRADEVRPPLPCEEVRSSAPAVASGFFVVPRVVGS